MKKGLREATRKENKKRIEAMREILEDLDYIATEIVKDWMKSEEFKPFTEEEFKHEAQKYTDRELGKMELSIIRSKIAHFEEALEAKRKEMHGSKDNV